MFYNQDYVDKYMSALFYELDLLPKETIKTIYIGGGTPLALDIKSLNQLLEKLKSLYKLDDLDEFSVETTISAIDEEKIKLLKKYHVNRISIGIQTFKKLPYLNRYDEYKIVKEQTDLLKSMGFNNINFDLIYGWPSLNLKDFKEDVECILSLNPAHVSLYPLAIEDNTILSYKKIKPIEDDEYAKFYEEGINLLQDAGIYRYEISNFSKPGFESKHNLSYWKSYDYLAAGLGATSFYNNHRIKRTLSLKKYLSHDFIDIDEKEELKELKNDFLLLNLRLVNGFKLADYYERFKEDFLKEYKKEINDTKEFLEIDKTSVKIKPSKLYILDSILVDLLK